MADIIEIPRIRENDDWYAKSPAWAPVVDSDGNKLKPHIRCNCGQWSGIGLHHVHADGIVTASFFHARKNEHPQGDDSGCGWHVILKLKDYDQGDFPPRTNQS